MTRERPITTKAWIKLARNDALRKQRGRCAYCLGTLPKDKATADHVKARIKGGWSRPDNIVAACRLCNHTKGSMSEARFRKEIKGHDRAPLNIMLCRAVRRLNLEADRACSRILQFAGAA